MTKPTWERLDDNSAAWCDIAPEWELCITPVAVDRPGRFICAWRGPFRVSVVKHDGTEEQNVVETYRYKRTYPTAQEARDAAMRLWRKHYDGMILA